ncbi:MAG: ARMT1-like domain-containing protein [Chromatiales bacterium]
MKDTTTSDEVRTPNFFSIYESSTITTTDQGTKAGKIIQGYVEETLKEARREYRFRDETERKLRRLQERLKYDFLHTHMPFVRAMAFFSNEFYRIVKQWNPKPFEHMRVQQTQLGLQKVSKRLLELEELIESEGVEGALSEIMLQIMLSSKFDPSHMTEMDDTTIIETDQRREAIQIMQKGRRIDLVSDNFGMELIWSLVLADLLLSSGILKRVAFHVKKEPFAFTDATRADFFSTILDFTEFEYQLDKYAFVEIFNNDIAKLDQFWQKLSRFGELDKTSFKITLNCEQSGVDIVRGLDLDFPEVKDAVLDVVARYDEINTKIMAMGRRLMAYVDDERIIVDDDPFWTTDGYLEQIPDDIIRRHFERSSLILFLGAFNFRRLNRDRYWKAEKNPQFEDIIPFSLRHLNIFVPRLIKAETLVGVSRKRAIQLDAENPKWNQTGGHGAFMLFKKFL